MLLNNNTIKLELTLKPICNRIGTIKLFYNMENDTISFLPCAGVLPKEYIEPISFNSKYFVDNLKKCIDDFENLNIGNLDNYYLGSCSGAYPYSNKLCKNYNYNKHIIDLDLATSNSCNLNCVMCTQKSNNTELQSIRYKELLKAAEDLELDIIYPTASGEPLIFKKETFEFIKNSKSKNIKIVTNAILLNDDDIIYLSKFNNKLKFKVSMDGITEEVYNSIRIYGDYNKVLHNIKLLRDNNLLENIFYVAQDLNYSEQDRVIDFFNNLDVKVDILIDRTYSTGLVNKDLINNHNYKKGLC